jgi:hypothetical protein
MTLKPAMASFSVSFANGLAHFVSSTSSLAIIFHRAVAV